MIGHLLVCHARSRLAASACFRRALILASALVWALASASIATASPTPAARVPAASSGSVPLYRSERKFSSRSDDCSRCAKRIGGIGEDFGRVVEFQRNGHEELP